MHGDEDAGSSRRDSAAGAAETERSESGRSCILPKGRHGASDRVQREPPGEGDRKGPRNTRPGSERWPSPKRLELADGSKIKVPWQRSGQVGQPYVEMGRAQQSGQKAGPRTDLNHKRKYRRAATAKKLAEARGSGQCEAARSSADRGGRCARSPGERSIDSRGRLQNQRGPPGRGQTEATRSEARVPQRTVRGPSRDDRGAAAAGTEEQGRAPKFASPRQPPGQGRHKPKGSNWWPKRPA